jgi:ketosteroid isomerase-like protein
MDTANSKAVVARFDELGNSGGDLAALDELCTPDLVNHALAPGRPQGLEGTREFLQMAQRNRHPGRFEHLREPHRRVRRLIGLRAQRAAGL